LLRLRDRTARASVRLSGTGWPIFRFWNKTEAVQPHYPYSYRCKVLILSRNLPIGSKMFQFQDKTNIALDCLYLKWTMRRRDVCFWQALVSCGRLSWLINCSRAARSAATHKVSGFVLSRPLISHLPRSMLS